MQARFELEDALDESGVFTEPYGKDTPIYDFRALLDYCEHIGRIPAELTDDERERFRTNY